MVGLQFNLDKTEVRSFIKELARQLRVFQHTSNYIWYSEAKYILKKLWKYRHTGFNGRI